MDPELKAMQVMSQALDPLEPDERKRVLDWLVSRFELRNPAVEVQTTSTQSLDRNMDDPPTRSSHPNTDYDPTDFPTYFSQCETESEADKALVAALWLQDHEGRDTFSSQEVNRLLKDLGHGIGNITRELGRLSAEKPNLVIQTRKRGSTKQARKEYKVTEAGRRRVGSLRQNDL